MNHPSPKRITLAFPPVPQPVTVAPAPWKIMVEGDKMKSCLDKFDLVFQFNIWNEKLAHGKQTFSDSCSFSDIQVNFLQWTIQFVKTNRDGHHIVKINAGKISLDWSFEHLARKWQEHNLRNKQLLIHFLALSIGCCFSWLPVILLITTPSQNHSKLQPRLQWPKIQNHKTKPPTKLSEIKSYAQILQSWILDE